jgi:hypothetical protein
MAGKNHGMLMASLLSVRSQQQQAAEPWPFSIFANLLVSRQIIAFS